MKKESCHKGEQLIGDPTQHGPDLKGTLDRHESGVNAHQDANGKKRPLASLPNTNLLLLLFYS